MGKDAEDNKGQRAAGAGGPSNEKPSLPAGRSASAPARQPLAWGPKPPPSSAGPGQPERPAWWRFLRYCLVLALAGGSALAWVSVLTYSPADWPGALVYPPPPPHNAGGTAGAAVAHVLLYWLGDGAYVLMLFATLAAVLMLVGGRISDWPWRVAGLGLMVATMSAASHLLSPGNPMNGNILGIAAGTFLVGLFSSIGTWIVLLVVFLASLMLTAENIVLRLPAVGRRLWSRGRPALSGASPGMGTPSVRGPAARPEAPDRPRPPAVKPAAPADAPARPDRETDAAKDRPGLSAAAAKLLAPRPKDPPKPKPAPPPQVEPDGQYRLPALDLLADPTTGYLESQEEMALAKREVLQKTLEDFGVQAQVVGHMTGPVISMFELALAPGVKVNHVDSLARDISRALAVPGVRVVSPLPGRDTIGVEVPNLDKEIVRLKELMALAPDAPDRMQVPLYLGKDAEGKPIVADLTRMPHLLLAGTTGSGKSVCINAILSSILLTRSPADVRVVLIDPKMVEMAAYENIPHLLCPIINDMRRVEDVLEWAAGKMDERYELLKQAGVRNIVAFNKLSPAEIHKRFAAELDEEKANCMTHMQYWIIIIDELADLIMTASKEVENHIIRIAQKARAVGIHLIVATQRPSVNVVTGLIKSNMPCRVSFRVASRQESRIVLDQNGAEVLLGQGDMLFLQPGDSHLARAQGTFVDDSEIRAVVEQVKRIGGPPAYNEELVSLQAGETELADGERDEMFDKAVEITLATQRGSVSLLQRRLSVGYSRASRIVDQMAQAGILGDFKGSQAREVNMTLEDWHTLKKSIAADQSGQSAADGTPTSA